MEIVPQEVRFAAAKLASFNRNRVRIESAGATSASAASILTFTLPEQAIICLRSFKVHLRAGTNSSNTNGTTVYANLPADISSLFSNMEVYIGGVSVQQSSAEYNTVCRMLKIARSSRDRDGSIDKLLHHGGVTTGDAADDISAVFVPPIGFFAESATRYLPTGITGPITVRLTCAPNSVLAHLLQGANHGANLGVQGRANAATTIYQLIDVYATCDTVAIDPMYEQLLLDRLSKEDFLPMNFKQYQTFSLHGTTGNSHTVRCALSAQSIDAGYAVFRDSNYQTRGIKTQLFTGVTLGDTSCANAFFFKSFNDADANVGALRYNWRVGSVLYPQSEATLMDAAFDLSYITDKTSPGSGGHMVTSLTHYQNGMCVIPLVLNMPGQPLHVTSGYDSRGNSTQIEFIVKGQTPPTADPATGTTAAISTMVVLESTCQMRISAGRQVSVQY